MALAGPETTDPASPEFLLTQGLVGHYEYGIAEPHGSGGNSQLPVG